MRVGPAPFWSSIVLICAGVAPLRAAAEGEAARPQDPPRIRSIFDEDGPSSSPPPPRAVKDPAPAPPAVAEPPAPSPPPVEPAPVEPAPGKPKPPPVAKPVKPAKPLPPEGEALAKAERLVRWLHSADYAKRAVGARAALARTMLKQGVTPAYDADGRFVLLREACAVAAKAGDVATSLSSVDEIERAYQVDAPAMKLAALLAASDGVALTDPRRARAVAEAALAVVESRGAGDDAPALLEVAARAAAATRDAALVARVDTHKAGTRVAPPATQPATRAGR